MLLRKEGITTERWYPKAKKDLFSSAGLFTLDLPWRGVLHTMEGTYAGSRVVYSKSGVAPQFSVENDKVYQHMGLDEAGKALVNLAGGVETNRARAVQIEVSGYATKPWNDITIATVRDLMIWIEGQTGIKPKAPLQFKPYPSSYGAANGVRMTPSAWNAADSWYGHMHIPENLHGDPGAIPIDQLLIRPTKEVKPMWDPPLQVTAFLPYWKGSGGYMLFSDGGIGAVGDAPYRGAENQPLGHDYWIGFKPATMERLGEDGYAVIATTGARYEYP